MEQEDIKKLYIRLSKDFSMLSFEEVLAECLKIAKKFYACYATQDFLETKESEKEV